MAVLTLAYDRFDSFIHMLLRQLVTNHKPQKARQGLPMAPWFKGTCRAYKTAACEVQKPYCRPQTCLQCILQNEKEGRAQSSRNG
eukprot:1146096-Pelagomonas_calceolata.AAC.2